MMGADKSLSSQLREYRKDASKAANDLGYGDRVLSMIKAAKSIAEIGRIMASARKGEYNNGKL